PYHLTHTNNHILKVLNRSHPETQLIVAEGIKLNKWDEGPGKREYSLIQAIESKHNSNSPGVKNARQKRHANEYIRDFCVT
ncbi:MAG: hypothetical protein ACRD4F_15205, partial [Candidatus Angelobacter sp.]